MSFAPGRTTISAVIPAYNRAHIIGRAIESALAQTRVPDEILVVDDCSSDATRDVLAAWQVREPRVRPVYRETNGGPAGARNAGVAAARCDLVAFLDSDDVWLPGHLETCEALLRADAALDVAFADLRREYTSGRVIQSSYLTGHKGIRRYLEAYPGDAGWYRFQEPEAAVLFRESVVPVQTAVIRAETARRFPFAETLRGPEDYDLFLRLARAGKRFGYVDRVQCVCLLGDDNLVGNGSDLRMCGEDIKLWRGVLRDPAVERIERAHCHRHLSRLWHDTGHTLVRGGAPDRAVRAYVQSLWHRPSVRAARGLVRAAVGWVAGRPTA